MWLNGRAQFDDHETGKKHRKNIKKAVGTACDAWLNRPQGPKGGYGSEASTIDTQGWEGAESGSSLAKHDGQIKFAHAAKGMKGHIHIHDITRRHLHDHGEGSVATFGLRAKAPGSNCESKFSVLFHNGDDACAVHPVPDGTGANRCQLTRALCCNDSRSVCPVSYEVSSPGRKGACLHDDAGGGRRSSGTGHHVPEASCHPEACLQNAGGDREEADEARGARATGLSARRAGNQATGIIGITGRYVAGSPQSAANILNMHGFVVLGVQHTVADSDLDALKDVMIEEAQRKEAYWQQGRCSLTSAHAIGNPARC